MMMRIKYNAELAEPNMCFKCMGVCGCFPCLGICAPPCSFYDMERSYLYLRENSIESNVNINNYVGDCLGCPTADFVTVSYFDRPPYAVSGCICPTVPKLEVVDTSCYFCCMRCGGQVRLYHALRVLLPLLPQQDQQVLQLLRSLRPRRGRSHLLQWLLPAAGKHRGVRRDGPAGHSPRAAHGVRARCVIDRLRSRGAPMCREERGLAC